MKRTPATGRATLLPIACNFSFALATEAAPFVNNCLYLTLAPRFSYNILFRSSWKIF